MNLLKLLHNHKIIVHIALFTQAYFAVGMSPLLKTMLLLELRSDVSIKFNVSDIS